MADEKPYNISIEVKAQLEEIQKLLDELRSISAEMSKINGQTFSAVSMSAAELSKTGKDLAKALVSQRIASEEFNKMLGKTGSGLENAKEKTKKFKDEVDGTKNSITGFYMELGAMAARMVTHLPSAVTATIQAFGQQEMVLQKLSAAVRTNGGNVSEVLPIMQQFASDIQAITTYGDEQVHSMMAMATSMGVNAGQMDIVMRSAIGLSTALGMDVTTATKAAASAIQGKTGMLQEYIPSLVKCKTEEEKLAQVQRLSESGFAQAEAAANTLDGKLKQAANAWGDLQEVMGEAFAPTVKAVAGLIKGICALLTENAAVTKTLTIALTSCAVGFAFTKVGGLANVAKMILGVTTATKGATTAMHAFNLAIKANPIGLIASAAAAAVLGLAQLVDYYLNLESEEQKEIAAQEAAREARRRTAEDARAASAVLDEYAESVAREGESADDTAKRMSALAAEIESLSDRSKWAENGQEEAAQKLVDKKKELVELQKKYLEQVNATAEAEYQYASNRETERKYRVEQELNAARKTGIAHIIKFKEAELAHVEELQKSVEIQKKYYADHVHLVKSEEDRKRIMADAAEYANSVIERSREESRDAKWLNSELEKSKNEQRGLEMDILRARAAGNEAEAKDLELKLKISQTASEIFEATRKEGMGREELKRLQSDAAEKAREKCELEKSITDEVERQNLAKDAQAKIEDILLTNKIEQLKAEGKLAEAQSLEDERSIKRTLSGMKGLSEEQKKSLAETMRQTNAYREQQQNKSAAGDARTPGTGSTAASSLRTSSPPKTGGKEDGRPATVSEKSAGYYDEWKAAGGSRSGIYWTDFRKQKQAQESKQSNGKKQPSSSAYSSQSVSILDNIEERSWAMANGVVFKDNNPPKTATPNVGGAVNDASKSASNDFRTRQTLKPAETSLKKKAALPTLNNKLDSIGVKSEETTENNSAQSLGDIAASVRTLCEDIKSLKTTVTALAEKRNK